MDILQNFYLKNPTNLVVSWGHIYGNPLETLVWGQILSKANNLGLQIIQFSFLFHVHFVLSWSPL